MHCQRNDSSFQHLTTSNLPHSILFNMFYLYLQFSLQDFNFEDPTKRRYFYRDSPRDFTRCQPIRRITNNPRNEMWVIARNPPEDLLGPHALLRLVCASKCTHRCNRVQPRCGTESRAILARDLNFNSQLWPTLEIAPNICPQFKNERSWTILVGIVWRWHETF